MRELVVQLAWRHIRLQFYYNHNNLKNRTDNKKLIRWRLFEWNSSHVFREIRVEIPNSMYYKKFKMETQKPPKYRIS